MIAGWLRHNSDILMFIHYRKVTMNEVSILFKSDRNILNILLSVF